MGWIIAALGALAGAAAGGFLTYGIMSVSEAIVVERAVKAERDAGVVTCNSRVTEIERVHNKAVTDAVEEARRAAEAVTPTPETPAEIVELCQKSSSCRSRK